jgi:hypothetical protein
MNTSRTCQEIRQRATGSSRMTGPVNRPGEGGLSGAWSKRPSTPSYSVAVKNRS